MEANFMKSSVREERLCLMVLATRFCLMMGTLKFAQFSILFYQVKFIFASTLDYFSIVHKLLTSQWVASLPDLKTIILTDLSNQRFLQSPVMAWLQTCHRNIQIKNQYQQRLNQKNIHSKQAISPPLDN